VIGVFPSLLYNLLPGQGVGYQPYTAGHVITQFQLLLFAALAFGVLLKTRIYPPEVPSLNLDFDWTYRKVLPAFVGVTLHVGGRARESLTAAAMSGLRLVSREAQRLHGPEGILARTWHTGSIAIWAVVALGFYLLLSFIF
jgi:multicomponent Na+:H+ antiporter subunit D